MKRRYCAVVSLILAILLTFSGCSDTADMGNSELKKDTVSYKAIQPSGELAPNFEDIKDWKLASENKYLILYYREDTAAVRVFDKRNGSIWDSNPEGENLNNAALSQITLSTISAKGVIKDYTSYADSVMKKQVEFDCKRGLTVTYVFGNQKPDLSGVPSRLTDERFTELQKRVKEAEGNIKLLERRYVKGDDGIWTRKSSLTTDQSKKLRELFELIGYTEAELKEDKSAAGGAEKEESTSFSIPLKYTLSDDSLSVSISGKDMIYPSSEIITSMTVLGYFGASEKGDNGYFLLPNGSGALVDTSVADAATYSLDLYNTDYTIPVERESEKDVKNLLPIFGISREKDGVFAIIEDNDAVASINVSKSGNVDDFNKINASFAVNAAENIGLSTDSVSKFYVTSEKRYEGDTAIRYIFLGEEFHTYSGMAAIYRDYLDNNLNRKRTEGKGDISLTVETVGSLEGEASTLGFVHKKSVALTTFQNDISVLNDMNKAGIKNVFLVLSGWMNGGENQKIADNVDVESVLGGKSGLSKLFDSAQKLGFKIYPKVLLNTFSGNDSIVTKNLYASKTLGSEKSKYYAYDKLTGNALSDGSERYILSPSRQMPVSQKLIEALKDKNVNGLLIDDLSSGVYSDYKDENEFLRQPSILQSGRIVSEFSKKLDNLMLAAPNVYTAPYGKVYTDVPMSSGSYTALDSSVPFYQMVFHGYAEYSSSALNFTADLRTNLLKCVEYGASPKFRFVYNSTDELSPDEQSQYYAASYSRWKETAVEAYKELNGLLSSVKNAAMVKHTMLSNGVSRVDYDNNISVFVNYNNAKVKVDNVEIPPLSALKKEGNQ